MYVSRGVDSSVRTLIEQHGGVVVDNPSKDILAIMPKGSSASKLKTLHDAVSECWVHACIKQRCLLKSRPYALDEAKRIPRVLRAQSTELAGHVPIGMDVAGLEEIQSTQSAADYWSSAGAATGAPPRERRYRGPAGRDLTSAVEDVNFELSIPKPEPRGRNGGRLHFTAEEDQAMQQWVASRPLMPDQGRLLWQEAESAGITRHGWASMQNRWRRQLRKSASWVQYKIRAEGDVAAGTIGAVDADALDQSSSRPLKPNSSAGRTSVGKFGRRNSRHLAIVGRRNSPASQRSAMVVRGVEASSSAVKRVRGSAWFEDVRARGSTDLQRVCEPSPRHLFKDGARLRLPRCAASARGWLGKSSLTKRSSIESEVDVATDLASRTAHVQKVMPEWLRELHTWVDVDGI